MDKSWLKRLLIAAATIAAIAGAGVAIGHSGGTDQYGCHIDHSTGIRHCH